MFKVTTVKLHCKTELPVQHYFQSSWFQLHYVKHFPSDRPGCCKFYR